MGWVGRPEAAMVGDYSGFHEGEAQNGAPSAGHLVNEEWVCSGATYTLTHTHTLVMFI